MEKKRHTFNIQLNSISELDNPTQKECEFILHDFDVSWNNTIISKETAEKALPTLEHMPIVCKYYPVSQPGADDDALGSHEAVIGEDRETGDLIVELQTIAIGVFTEPAYITTITDENGNEKEVVAGKGILWSSRYPNIIGLLKEWIDEGINIVSSMEILYDSYLFKDGVEEILNFTYDGHCILNSQERGNHPKVYPAYDVSKLTRLVAQAINQENKEGEKMDKFKKVFELSYGDICSLLYAKLDPTLDEGSYSWISNSDVYDEYFVACIISDEGEKYFKYNYTKSENDVTIDFDSKTEVQLKRDWIEVTEVQQMQASLDEKITRIEELEKQLNSANEQIDLIKGEKEKVTQQFNEVTEKVVTLTSQVEELKPFKEQFEKEKLEQALNEKQELYKGKFEALNALEKFNEDEVQGLIKKTVFENDEGKQAIFQLNSMLVDMVTVQKETQNKSNALVKELSSRRENLIPEDDDFMSRYSK